jgi:hypothetical protein
VVRERREAGLGMAMLLGVTAARRWRGVECWSEYMEVSVGLTTVASIYPLISETGKTCGDGSHAAAVAAVTGR